MPLQLLTKKITTFLDATTALGTVGLLVIEDTQNSQNNLAHTQKIVSAVPYHYCHTYLAIMDALSRHETKILYVEQGDRLDSSVLEIVAEFSAGKVSIADKLHLTGLKTATWNPLTTSCIIVLTRQQLEASYPRLFDYVHLVHSL